MPFVQRTIAFAPSVIHSRRANSRAFNEGQTHADVRAFHRQPLDLVAESGLSGIQASRCSTNETGT